MEVRVASDAYCNVVTSALIHPAAEGAFAAYFNLCRLSNVFGHFSQVNTGPWVGTARLGPAVAEGRLDGVLCPA